MADLAGLLGLDPELLKLLQAGQQQPDNKSAMWNGLMAAGASMLANSHKGLAGSLGEGSLLGMQAYQAERQRQQKDPMQQIGALNAIMDLRGKSQTQQRTAEQEAAYKRIVGELNAPPQSAGMVGPPADAAPNFVGPPAMDNQAPAPAQPPSRNATFDYYMKLSRKLGDAGLLEQSNAMLDRAEKFRPELKEQKVLVDPKTQQRTVLNIYKDGQTEVVPYSPDVEQLHFLNRGGTTIGVDSRTGAPSVEYQNTASPDAVMSDRRSSDQFDRTERRQASQFDRTQSQADRHFNTTANAPQVFDTGDGVRLIDRRSGIARPVTDEAGNSLTKEKPLTETQGNAAAFGMRMRSANDTVNALEDAGVSLTSPKNLLAKSGITNVLATPSAQSLYQAKLNFMTASLRKESGAAISDSEYANEDKKYFPQPGDSQKVLAQKRAARELAIEGVAIQAGPGARRIGAAQSQAAPQQAAPPRKPLTVADLEAEMRRRGM